MPIVKHIRLGSMAVNTNPNRDFGRATAMVNCDSDKTNEVAKRKGYIRRIQQQLCGPVRLLHSFGGLCGRFYQMVDGGGLIYISGDQGSGPLSSELSVDGDEVGTGQGDDLPGNDVTPGGGGSEEDSNGVFILGSGPSRVDSASTPSSTETDSGEEIGATDFSFSADLSALHTVDLTWTFKGTNPPDAYIEIWKSTTGEPFLSEDAELAFRYIGWAGTTTDTIDEYASKVYYSILYYWPGVDVYGPYTDSTDQQVGKFSIIIPENIVEDVENTIDIQKLYNDCLLYTSPSPRDS